MRLGDWIEKIISILTFNKGYVISMWIANKLGYEDCGCHDRRDWLNNLFSKKDNNDEFIYIIDDGDIYEK